MVAYNIITYDVLRIAPFKAIKIIQLKVDFSDCNLLNSFSDAFPISAPCAPLQTYICLNESKRDGHTHTL